MRKTFLITGASGGMFGATYFRELYWQKLKGNDINLQSQQYVDDISKDLLNPMFLAFIARDLAGPTQKFKYNNFSYSKDRGFAFEQKLLQNTRGLLNKKLGDYTTPEDSADIPSIIYNATISRDGRKLIVASRPARFLMTGVVDSSNSLRISPDAVDFISLCSKQGPLNLRITSALRMNATFPYVLPNVWLPTSPVVDVMDAGFRDNSGQESSLRFIDVFKQWLHDNTSGIVLIQIRDRQLNDWEIPYDGNDVLNFVTKPFLLLQKNWYKLQDYYLTTQLQYMRHDKNSNNLYKIYFQYVPNRKEASASLSFHLNSSEKADIAEALDNTINRQSFEIVEEMIK